MSLEDQFAKITEAAARRQGPSHPPGRAQMVATVIGIGLLLAAVVGGIVAISSFSRTGPNEVAVIYNGGPLDKKTQRQVIPPASGLTWTGWLSQDARYYPSDASPRRYIITSDAGRGERVGVDVVRVPTSDGIDVGLEAKISFTTAFTGADDDKLVRDFDARFGNRTYPQPGGGPRLNPWQGDEGFGAFLDIEFRPVLDNALRESIATFTCEQLVSSCALVGGGRDVTVKQDAGELTNANLVRVQDAIAKALREDLARNLGGEFFRGVQVIVSGVRLPKTVQDAVDEAQAQFAEVNKSKADLQKAQIRKQVNDALGASYKSCPACAQIDALRAIPPNVTAISLGGSGTIALSPNR